MDVVFRKRGVRAAGKLYRAVAALVDLVILHGDVGAVQRHHAVRTAAEEAAASHVDALAAPEIQHRAGAGARAEGVTRGDALDGDVFAVVEANHVRVARQRLDARGILVRADDGEVFHAGDHEAGAVKQVYPIVILAAVGAVGGGFRQIVEPL